MNFNERLRKIRQAKGIKQEALAELVGVERNTISRWELGTYEPRLSDLLKLAAVLSVSVEELMTGQKPAVITVRHGELSVDIPATPEGFAFVEEKLKEATTAESLPARSGKAV